MSSLTRSSGWCLGAFLLGFCSIVHSASGLNAPLSLKAARSFDLASSRHSVVVDLNLDGVPDLVAVEAGGSLAVLLGKGDATYAPTVRIPIAADPMFIAAADFNADGKPDLAIANGQSGTVSILIGRGDGGLLGSYDVQVGAAPISVAAADLDNNGTQDLAVACSGSSTTNGGCVVLRGNGDGTFQGPVQVASLSELTFVATGDFNGDKKVDLALARRGDYSLVKLPWPGTTGLRRTNAWVSIFLNRGDGKFELGSHFEVFPEPVWVAVGDCNRDGRLDMAVACYAGPDYAVNPGLSVLRGRGDGTFYAAETYWTGGLPSSAAIADMDLDGFADVVVNSEGFGMRNYVGVSILYGKEGGALDSPQRIGGSCSMGGAVAVHVTDLDRDGQPDIVTTGSGATVLLQSRRRQFTVADTRELNTTGNDNGTFTGIGDLNRDGFLDLVIVKNTVEEPGVCSVWSALGGPGDTFMLLNQSLPGFLSRPVVADFNDDSFPDLLGINRSGQALIFPGTGNGSFGQAIMTSLIARAGALVAADFTRNGRPDVISMDDSGFSFFAGSSNSFVAPINYSVGPEWRLESLAHEDFDRDGIQDIALLASSRAGTGATMDVLRGKGDGSFSLLFTDSAGVVSGTIFVADLNHDRKVDLVVNDPSSGKIAVLFGRGDGSFQAAVRNDFSGSVVQVLDMNGDGLPDLVGSAPLVALGKGDGSFSSPDYYTMGRNPAPWAIGDFNGDGKPDIVAVVNRPNLALDTAWAMSVIWNISPLPLRLVSSLGPEGLTLSWPDSANDFGLESTLTFNPTDWRSVPESPARTNGHYELTLPADGAGKLFRLMLPAGAVQ